MRMSSVSEEDFRAAAIKTCEAMRGAGGCSCEPTPGQYCESIATTWSRLFGWEVAQDSVVALINGKATIRKKPSR